MIVRVGPRHLHGDGGRPDWMDGMVFSSLAFLCVFLPICLLVERIAPTTSLKNAVLIVASLFFYAYGEPVLVLLMIVSTLFNYLMGLAVGKAKGGRRKVWLALAVCVNLGLLVVFKYAGMLVSTVNSITGLGIAIPQIPLPLGISFYTFQALSYVIDVYRGEVEAQHRYSRILLYVSFFPQLIAGPIVKYHDIELQMAHRSASLEDTAVGLRRFCLGLAKKVLIANTMASAADALIGLSTPTLNAPCAWLAAFAYLDFSGYSDMAIGLSRVFGFHLKENFDHPYASTSIKEFWRRWHISLSTWLREYLYFPLGGNRKGRTRAWVNRIIVFFLCGLWHGASWTFVVWGLCHGLLLLLEDVIPLRKMPRALGHVYTILFVMVTFVIFRCDTLGEGINVIRTMFVGWSFSNASTIAFMEQLTPVFIITSIVAIAMAGSLPGKLREYIEKNETRLGGRVAVACYATTFVLLVACILTLSSGTYNPFIYFRF